MRSATLLELKDEGAPKNLMERVCKNVVRGFSLVHDPKGSHYENLGYEDYLKLDEARCFE